MYDRVELRGNIGNSLISQVRENEYYLKLQSHELQLCLFLRLRGTPSGRRNDHCCLKVITQSRTYAMLFDSLEIRDESHQPAAGVGSCRCAGSRGQVRTSSCLDSCHAGRVPWLPLPLVPPAWILEISSMIMSCLWALQWAKKYKAVIYSYSDCCLQTFIFDPRFCCTCFPFCTSPWHSTGTHQADLQDPRQRETNILMQTLQQKREMLEMHCEFSQAPSS